MALKMLEKLVESLLGESVIFYESEEVSSGITSVFPFAYPKKKQNGSSPIVFHGSEAYQASPKKEDAEKPKGKFKFFGEESYTPSDVPRVSSIPAPAVDADAAAKEPTGYDAAQEIVLKNPAITGAALIQALNSLQVEIIDRKADVGASDSDAPDVKEQIALMLQKAPDISGQSLLAAMKSAGLEIGPKKAKESDSVTTHAGPLKQPKKKREAKKAVAYTVRDSRFLEASRDDGIGPTKFKVALIQEGLGNLRDCYYYTRECLEKAVATAAFEGRKCFADHPSASEEQDRPERSVRDIIGHFENVHVEEAEDGSAILAADLIIPHTQPFEWARTLVSAAINFSKKYPDRELVGLSINASGDAKVTPIDDFMATAQLPEMTKPKLLKAKEVGATQVRVVSEIKDAVSVDLVTEPGARGKILEFIEREKND